MAGPRGAPFRELGMTPNPTLAHLGGAFRLRWSRFAGKPPRLRSRVANGLLRRRTRRHPRAEQRDALVGPRTITRHVSRLEARKDARSVRGHLIVVPEVKSESHRSDIPVPEQGLDVTFESWRLRSGANVLLLVRCSRSAVIGRSGHPGILPAPFWTRALFASNRAGL